MTREARETGPPAYAVVRVDAFLGEDAPVERRVTVKKIVFGRERAEREVGRLNGLHPDGSVRYFSQYTRLDRDEKGRD